MFRVCLWFFVKSWLDFTFRAQIFNAARVSNKFYNSIITENQALEGSVSFPYSAMVQWLGLLHIFIQQSLNLGSADL